MAWQGKRALREGSTAAARVGQGPQPEAQGPPVTTHPCRPGPASPVLAALTAHRGDTPRGRGRWGKAWTALPGLRSAAGGAWPLSTRRTPTRGSTHVLAGDPAAQSSRHPCKTPGPACTPGWRQCWLLHWLSQWLSKKRNPEARYQGATQPPTADRRALPRGQQGSGPTSSQQNHHRPRRHQERQSARGPTVCRRSSQNRGLPRSRLPAALCTRDAQAPGPCTWAG